MVQSQAELDQRLTLNDVLMSLDIDRILASGTSATRDGIASYLSKLKNNVADKVKAIKEGKSDDTILSSFLRDGDINIEGGPGHARNEVIKQIAERCGYDGSLHQDQRVPTARTVKFRTAEVGSSDLGSVTLYSPLPMGEMITAPNGANWGLSFFRQLSPDPKANFDGIAFVRMNVSGPQVK